jgi:hypothetical protein
VSLTAVRLLAPHLTTENHRAVLESARGKTKLQVQEIVARLSPQPDVPASVRRLAAPATHPPSPATVRSGDASPPQTPPRDLSPPAAPPAASSAPLPARPAAVAPLSPDRYRLQLTISGDTLEKLRLAKDMLSHAVPTGDDAAVLDRALTALLVDLARKKCADTPRPRRSQGPADPANIPARVKRIVWVRDGGRCTFVGASGHRCEERRFVQFQHVDPRALGGEATADKIVLMCARHNDYEGRLYFGRRRRDGDGLVREAAERYGTGQSAGCANMFRNM